RIALLHRGLRPALRQSLEGTSDSLFSIPYDKYIEFVQSLDCRSRHPQPFQQLTSRQPVQPPKPASRQSDHMDIDPIRVNSVQVSSVRMPAPCLSRSLSKSSSKLLSRSLSKSSEERRAYCLKNNLCLCCGAANHWIGQISNS
ncbi:hypothetical protein EJ02DRAFT_358461, partial [Clathrospora elynae]